MTPVEELPLQKVVEEENSGEGVIHQEYGIVASPEAPKQQQLPQLYIDVNLGEDMEPQRIVVYPGDTPDSLAKDFCDQHNLDEETMENLKALLEQQIAAMLN